MPAATEGQRPVKDREWISKSRSPPPSAGRRGSGRAGAAGATGLASPRSPAPRAGAGGPDRDGAPEAPPRWDGDVQPGRPDARTRPIRPHRWPARARRTTRPRAAAAIGGALSRPGRAAGSPPPVRARPRAQPCAAPPSRPRPVAQTGLQPDTATGHARPPGGPAPARRTCRRARTVSPRATVRAPSRTSPPSRLTEPAKSMATDHLPDHGPQQPSAQKRPDRPIPG